MFCDLICIVFLYISSLSFCFVVSRCLWCYSYLMFLHDIVFHHFACTFTWHSPPWHCYSFLCSTLTFILLFEVPSSYLSTCLTFLLILFLSMLVILPPSDPKVNHMILEHGPFVYNKIASYDDLLINFSSIKISHWHMINKKLSFWRCHFVLGTSMDTSKI